MTPQNACCTRNRSDRASVNYRHKTALPFARAECKIFFPRTFVPLLWRRRFARTCICIYGCRLAPHRNYVTAEDRSINPCFRIVKVCNRSAQKWPRIRPGVRMQKPGVLRLPVFGEEICGSGSTPTRGGRTSGHL